MFKPSYKIVSVRIIISMKIRFKKNKKFSKKFSRKNKIRPLLKTPEKDFQKAKEILTQSPIRL